MRRQTLGSTSDLAESAVSAALWQAAAAAAPVPLIDTGRGGVRSSWAPVAPGVLAALLVLIVCAALRLFLAFETALR